MNSNFYFTLQYYYLFPPFSFRNLNRCNPTIQRTAKHAARPTRYDRNCGDGGGISRRRPKYPSSRSPVRFTHHFIFQNIAFLLLLETPLYAPVSPVKIIYAIGNLNRNNYYKDPTNTQKITTCRKFGKR